MFVATRGLYRMAAPTVIVPKTIKENVETIFQAHRDMDQSELNHTLIGLDVGNNYLLINTWFIHLFQKSYVLNGCRVF